MINPVEFRVLSADPDFYKLTFSLEPPEQGNSLFKILSEATQLKLQTLLTEKALKVFSVSSKIDLFEPLETNSGYVEIDTLHFCETVIALDAYLYDLDGNLKGKASCTFTLFAQSSATVR
jgi:hypothetical protein